MKQYLIIFFIAMIMFSCKNTDDVDTAWQFQIENQTDEIIKIKFIRKGVTEFDNTNPGMNKEFTFDKNKTISVFYRSGLEGDDPSEYDTAFIYYKDIVFIDTAPPPTKENSLLNSSIYKETSRNTKKGFTTVYTTLVINQDFITKKLNE